ncbi:hypothetical protein SAMN06265795_103117 [Noviherbaspirillum humi]|uniref:Uncharacterized protein n=1 Tax=Noviherbaspirillum humi TaxID=1688639 RepID=A0A239F2V3_9BURK|nr:hypothetical protein SAMN06265795_103117 [Noviherbaspirillum humi]
MAKLQLPVAIGDCDRTRALRDGSVQIDGVDPGCMTASPGNIFFRAFRHQAVGRPGSPPRCERLSDIRTTIRPRNDFKPVSNQSR